MKRITLRIIVVLFVLGFFITGSCAEKEDVSIGMAVEFMDHAASAYVSQYQGWFEEEGLNITSYESYVTGMALASALGRGDIQAAYICLVPAINAYANAKVPIKIVAGTHKYGYGLVVDSNKIECIQDIEREEMRIGCVREGGAVDVLLHKTINKYNLNENKVLSNIQRMNPPKQLLAIQMGRLDAAFLPEQWATMAEDLGYRMLLMSQDAWPEMQGSVLVVKTELLEDYPEVVRKLVKVTEKATNWINQNPEKAAEIVAKQLSMDGEDILPAQIKNIDMNMIEFSTETLFKSMGRLNYSTDIDISTVQSTINFLEELGYIKDTFNAEDLLDLRFLKG